jgi:hypothetical protein
MATSQVFVTDWYVRPTGGIYGNEDGTSYDNAWDGLLNVVWSAGGIQAGDTLYICGPHVHEMVNTNNIANQADITVSASGSSGNRIIIRGDYPGDAGIVWEAYKVSYDTWDYEGSNTYSIDLIGSHYGDWFFEDVIAESWVVLDKYSNLSDVQSHAGSFWFDRPGTNKQ